MMQRRAIEGRLDAYFQKPEFKHLRDKFEKNSFKNVGKVILSWNRGDGPRTGFYTEDTENGVYFLRVNNLKNHTIDLKNIKYINPNIVILSNM